jgi:4-hydroxybenzoate polyprenyltransferase
MMMAVAALWARSLGCLYNDWVDRKIDLCVDRTRSRPLACGDLSGKDLIYLATLWGVMGIPFLWLFPLPVLFLGVVGLGGSIIYPFLKRVWGYPQFFLGFLFNLGVFGPSLWYGGFSTIWGPWVALYIQGILWTVEYDSIYACQDYEDDKRMTMFSFPVTIGKKNVKSYILLSIIARYLILSIVCKKNQGIFGAVMILEFIEIILLDIECVRSCGDYFKRCPLKGLAITAALL